MSIASFLEKNYRHFNARETLAAAKGWHEFCKKGGKMLVSLAGAMSTAEIGITLAPLIRAGKVHAISSTAANMEEDLFNLVGNSRYKLQPKWRYLTMEDDLRTREEGFNRVTDTCIPEDVMIQIHEAMRELWAAARSGERSFHWEYFYKLIRSGFFADKHDVPLEHSWVVAACEMDIPIYTPGMEDSTLGNMFCADVMQGHVGSHNVIKSGTEQFEHLTNWYYENQKKADIGFFQIGGGIAGDFAMCVIPGLVFDHKHEDCKCWKYFCHIGDSTTSYGSYSGCPANEKVSWYKLDPGTVNFTINSDASIVAPLIFSYLLEKHMEEVAAGKAEELGKGKMRKKGVEV